MVKIRQVDELTKGSCEKLFQEKTMGEICIKGIWVGGAQESLKRTVDN